MFLDKEVGEMHTPLSWETFICARESVFLPLAGNLCRRAAQHRAASRIRQHSSTQGRRQSALACPPSLNRMLWVASSLCVDPRASKATLDPLSVAFTLSLSLLHFQDEWRMGAAWT